MRFLTADPVECIYMILKEFHKGKNCGSFSSRSITLTNESNSLTCTVASSLVRTSPLAVITVVGLLDVLMLSNSAKLRSFLLTKCILAPESTTDSLSSGSFVDATGSTYFSAGEKNVALSFSLNLKMFLARFQALLWAHRSCLSVSSWDWSSQAMVLSCLGYSLDAA